MSFARWLTRLIDTKRSTRRARPRRYTSPLSPYGARDWQLEDRIAPSTGPFALPLPNPNPNTNLSSVLYTGGLVTNMNAVAFGKTFSAPPGKFVTIQNNSTQIIYPYFRDANSGKEPASGNFYDPADPNDQEYRAYIGWQDTSNNQWLGVPAGASITVQVPLVFWDGANIYYVADGQNLTAVGPPNIYGYTTASTRYIATSQSATSGGIQWVPNFTPPINNTMNAKYGLVMFYHDTLPGTALPASASQLTEFTIRDVYLKNFGITDDQAHELINYDISYVDSAIFPIAMEATNVPIPGSNPSTNADFGWAGSTLDFTAVQTALQQFTSNSTGILGSYFGPLGSTANGPGWPYFFNGNGNPPPFGFKIPGGANIFAESPLNDVRSKYDPTNNTWALSSGGFDPIFVSQATAPGGQSGTSVTLDFPNQAARDFYVTTINLWLTNGEKPITATITNNNSVLGTVTGAANGGTSTSATITLSKSVSIPNPVSIDCTRPVTDFAASRIRDLFYAWATYYYNQFLNFKGASYGGTITPQVINPKTSRLNRLVLTNPNPTGLAMGMTVTGNGISAGTTILYIDPTHPNWIYLSQNAKSGASDPGYKFGAPQKMPFSNDAGIQPITLKFAAGADSDTAKAFAASVYEAMLVESQVTDFPTMPVLPKSMVVVQNVIGADFNLLNADPTLGGQLRDIIKSILRGVPDFTLPQYSNSDKWYPNPAQGTGSQTFNVYNLDPYVFFVHRILNMSAYGFSVDDDQGDINADNTNSLTYVVSGIAGLPNKNEWQPSLHYGFQIAMAQVLGPVTVQTANGPVTGNAINLQSNAQYWQIGFDDPANSIIGAYVVGPGIPAGTRVVAQGPTTSLQLVLSTTDAKPTKGLVRFIFTGQKNTATNPFNDSFERPNSGSLGSNWTNLLGEMGVNNHQAVGVSTPPSSGFTVDMTQVNGNGTNLTNMAVTATVSVTGNAYAGVFARSTPNVFMNKYPKFYAAMLVNDPTQPVNGSSNYLAIYRYTPDAPGQTGTVGGWVMLAQYKFLTTTTSGDLQLEVVGTGTHASLQLFFNNAAVLSWTEGDRVVTAYGGTLTYNPIGAGGAGMVDIRSMGSTATLSNFSVFSVPAPAQNIGPSLPQSSPPLLTSTNPNAIFVDYLYELLLDRQADTGAAGWVSMLNAGVSPAIVVEKIEATTEYLDKLVNNLYEQYLGRAADPGGLSAWVGSLQHGGTIENVIVGLASSPEYFSRQGGNNTAFVASLYTNILNRTGSASAVQGWVTQIFNGLPISQVVTDFLNSQEYRTDLVQSYYQTYLGRPADSAGLAGWLNQLGQGVHDQVVLASILGSPEGFADYSQGGLPPGTTNGNINYVEFLYESLLDRPADAAADFWVNQLDAGVSPVTVVAGIESSAEYLGDVVNNLYEQYLGRAADSGGLTSWVGQLQNGAPYETVISGLVNSPEYFAQQGHSTSGFVASLYTNILGRTGSASEVQGWVTQINNGLPASQVVSAFLSSQEYRTSVIESYYQMFLGRPADAQGLAAWLNQLNQGIQDQVVLASILGSSEAYGIYSMPTPVGV